MLDRKEHNIFRNIISIRVMNARLIVYLFHLLFFFDNAQLQACFGYIKTCVERGKGNVGRVLIRRIIFCLISSTRHLKH